MADKPRTSRALITRDALAGVYRDLLQLLAEFEMPATFAFVGMFTLTEQERVRYDAELGDWSYRGTAWTKNYRNEANARELDGWFCPEAFEMVRDHGEHEIGSHGFSHIPFDGPDTPAEALAREFHLAQEIAKTKSVTLKTFVFPRNRVGQLAAMRNAGFIGYRDALAQKGGPALRLLREAHVLDTCQTHGRLSDGMVSIPSGYFLNWRSGLRAKVPAIVTLNRWRSILTSATRTGGVAHIWSHPHNFITAPSTLDCFRRILQEAARLRNLGHLVIKTQAQYAEELSYSSLH